MQLRSRSIFPIIAVLAISTGCTANGGFIGTDYHPRGDITVRDASGTQLSTSATSPYAATGGFTLVLNETDFSGPYKVSVIKWNNGQKMPCFVAHQLNPTTYSFTADNGNAPGVTTPNACVAGDTEEAQISDGDGHTVLFYYELPGAIISNGPSTPSPSPSSSSSAAPSTCTTDPAQFTATLTGEQQSIDFACAGDLAAILTLPANTGAGKSLLLVSSVKDTLGGPLDSSLGTGVAALSISPNAPITIENAVQGVAFSVASPSLIVTGGIYAIQVYSSETNSVVGTYKNLVPAGGKIGVSVVVPGATIATSSALVAIIYRTS